MNNRYTETGERKMAHSKSLIFHSLPIFSRPLIHPLERRRRKGRGSKRKCGSVERYILVSYRRGRGREVDSQVNHLPICHASGKTSGKDGLNIPCSSHFGENSNCFFPTPLTDWKLFIPQWSQRKIHFQKFQRSFTR